MQDSAWLKSRRAQRAAGIAGILIAGCGAVIALGGWVFGVRWLAAPIPEAASMKVNTAVGVVLVGSAIAVLALTSRRWIATLIGPLLMVIGVVTLAEYATRSHATWFDQAFSTRVFGEPAEYVSRMGINTAFCFLLLGISLTLISRSKWINFAQALNLVVCLITYVAVLGYVMNVGFIIQPNASWTQMAPHTSALLFVASLAIFMLNPNSAIMSEIYDDHAGGRQARIMIPLVFVVSIVMGFAVRVMANIGLQEPIPAQIDVGLFTVALLPIIWVAASLSNRIDRERRQNEAISLVVESAPDGVLVVDQDGIVTVANATAATLIKLSADEIVGTCVVEYVPERARVGHASLRREFSDVPTSRSMAGGQNLELRAADGSQIPVDISLAPVDLGAKRDHIFVSIRDRSDLVRANRDLQQFAYVASHDLRAPLRTVAGFTDLLRHSLEARELSPEDADSLTEIAGGVDKMQRLIAALLDFSRLGRDAVDPQPSVMADDIADSLVLIHSDLTEVAMVATVDVPETIRWRVDEALMRTALLNIVANSIAYRRPGVAPQISFVADSPPYGGSGLTIRDNGQGIHLDHLERSTEMFQRLTTSGDGLGIGLAMVKRIVEVHNGRLQILSDGQTYTEISIWVPE